MPLLAQESFVSPLTTFLLDGTQSVPTKACGVPTVPSTVPAVLCKEVQTAEGLKTGVNLFCQ